MLIQKENLELVQILFEILFLFHLYQMYYYLLQQIHHHQILLFELILKMENLLH